ncbi:MAG: hypothetical protein KGZ39_01765 [Simkania sp.]|nr:hypothetical protein [Simkania sp.]
MRIAILFVLLFSNALFAFDLRYCLVVDASKHEANQKILKDILEQELASFNTEKTVADKADYLLGRVAQIAHALLRNGFSSDAYGLPDIDESSIAAYQRFALWEGAQNGVESIPLTFFAYVWPSSEFALQYNPTDPCNCRYLTLIHSHPISCSFSVLQGTLIQKNYELVDRVDRMVRLISEESFQELGGSIDRLTGPIFIHQLHGAGGFAPAVSLHAYGLATAEEVVRCFCETRSFHSYIDASSY